MGPVELTLGSDHADASRLALMLSATRWPFPEELHHFLIRPAVSKSAAQIAAQTGAFALVSLCPVILTNFAKRQNKDNSY